MPWFYIKMFLNRCTLIVLPQKFDNTYVYNAERVFIVKLLTDQLYHVEISKYSNRAVTNSNTLRTASC